MVASVQCTYILHQQKTYIFIIIQEEKLASIGCLYRQGSDWMCSECNHLFHRKLHLQDHIESKHIPHVPYVCGVCPKKCKTMRSLRTHIAQHQRIDRINTILSD